MQRFSLEESENKRMSKNTMIKNVWSSYEPKEN